MPTGKLSIFNLVMLMPIARSNIANTRQIKRVDPSLPASHPHLTNKKVSRIIDSLTQSTLYLS